MPLCKINALSFERHWNKHASMRANNLFISVEGYIAGVRGQLSFSQFNIDKILTHGASLLGSEGVEYDAQELGESFAACNSIHSCV